MYVTSKDLYFTTQREYQTESDFLTAIACLLKEKVVILFLVMMTKEPPHIGRNIKRMRELLRIKQEYMAIQLGLSQQAISQLEQKETLEAPLLEKVAKVLNVPVEAIQNYDEEKTVNIISNTYNDNAVSNDCSSSVNYNFNPLDKLLEVVEKNEKLYERLVQVEREKNDLLQRLLEEKSR